MTIFKGENGVPRDEEAHEFWLEQALPKERIFEMGMKDNFWQMGDTGPCGPCSEIFYDMGDRPPRPGQRLPFGEAMRAMSRSGTWSSCSSIADAQGELTPLPKPSIDTGAGLERMAAVLQGKISNFETDLFVPLIERAAELTGRRLARRRRTKESRRRRSQPRCASLRTTRAPRLPHLRRRAARERRPRLCAAQDHAARYSPWPLLGQNKPFMHRDGVCGAR